MVTGGPQPTFDARGPGTRADTWDRHLDRHDRPALTLDGVRRIIVVGAHPDDESLGAGGLVLLARSAGIAVDLVCVTDGRASHPESPTHNAASLAVRRAAEWAEAAEVLGVEEHRRHWLGLPDGEVPTHVDDVVTTVVDLVGREQSVDPGPGTVLVAPWRQDGHPDHEAVGRATAAAARRTDSQLWEFPVWAWHWTDPGDGPLGDLRPIHLSTEARAGKRAAVRAHASQVGALSIRPGDEALLSPAVLAHFDRPTEWFLVTTGSDCPDDTLERLHGQIADPWGVDTRWYESRKRDLLLSILPRPRYSRVLEVGCSTGALTEALAGRVDLITGIDSSATALDAARARLSDQVNVDLRLVDVPRDWPEGEFDLIVLSEVGYFLSPDALRRVLDRVVGSLGEDPAVVLCHWRHAVRGWLLDAGAVHEQAERGLPLPLRATYVDRDVELRVHASSWPEPDR